MHLVQLRNFLFVCSKSQIQFLQCPTLQPSTKDISVTLWKYVVVVYIIQKGIWSSGMIFA